MELQSGIELINSSLEDYHLKSMLEGNNEEFPLPMTPAPSAPLLLRDLGNTFQNLRVSSPAPVTMEDPSGLIARYSTLKV